MTAIRYSKADEIVNDTDMREGMLVLGSGTTTERDAKDPDLIKDGSMWYNTTTNKFNGYENGAWLEFTLA